MPPLLDKCEAARATTCLFPRSFRELPTFAGFSGLGGTEVKRNGTEIHPPCWPVTLTFSKPVNHCCFPLLSHDSQHLHTEDDTQYLGMAGQLWETVEDGGAWHAAVYVVTKSQTRLSHWTTTTSTVGGKTDRMTLSDPIRYPLLFEGSLYITSLLQKSCKSTCVH